MHLSNTTKLGFFKSGINWFSNHTRRTISSPGDCHHPWIWPETLNRKAVIQNITSRTCMQNKQTFAFTRGYFGGIRPIIRKPHIICAVILVSPCFIHVHDIIPCFPKRFDLSQIITPVIDNRHLIVQNSSIITYFFFKVYPRSMRVRVSLDFDILKKSFISLCTSVAWGQVWAQKGAVQKTGVDVNISLCRLQRWHVIEHFVLYIFERIYIGMSCYPMQFIYWIKYSLN